MAGASQWRRDASNAFELLQQELNRLVENYLQPSEFVSPDSPPTDLEPTAWSPPVDVYSTSEGILIVAEVPGVNPSSIEITVEGQILTVRGVKDDIESPEASLRVRERLFGSFHRRVNLPDEIDFENAGAEINHGVLRIRLPKRGEAAARRIPIRTG